MISNLEARQKLMAMRQSHASRLLTSWCLVCGARRTFRPLGLSLCGTHLKYRCPDCSNPIYLRVKNDYEPQFD